MEESQGGVAGKRRRCHHRREASSSLDATVATVVTGTVGKPALLSSSEVAEEAAAAAAAAEGFKRVQVKATEDYAAGGDGDDDAAMDVDAGETREVSEADRAKEADELLRGLMRQMDDDGDEETGDDGEKKEKLDGDEEMQEDIDEGGNGSQDVANPLAASIPPRTANQPSRSEEWDNAPLFAHLTGEQVLSGAVHPDDITGTLMIRLAASYTNGEIRDRINALYAALGIRPRTSSAAYSHRWTKPLRYRFPGAQYHVEKARIEAVRKNLPKYRGAPSPSMHNLPKYHRLPRPRQQAVSSPVGVAGPSAAQPAIATTVSGNSHATWSAQPPATPADRVFVTYPNVGPTSWVDEQQQRLSLSRSPPPAPGSSLLPTKAHQLTVLQPTSAAGPPAPQSSLAVSSATKTAAWTPANPGRTLSGPAPGTHQQEQRYSLPPLLHTPLSKGTAQPADADTTDDLLQAARQRLRDKEFELTLLSDKHVKLQERHRGLQALHLYAMQGKSYQEWVGLVRQGRDLDVAARQEQQQQQAAGEKADPEDREVALWRAFERKNAKIVELGARVRELELELEVKMLRVGKGEGDLEVGDVVEE